ncbi:MAG: lysoplasmalogenase [Deltaproteobacteria bacterium]|nr:lysoplasmalogenase [Deltaproteobacteria bacterium]
MIAISLVIGTALATVATLYCRYRELRVGIYATKMLASTGFVATALASGAAATRPGQMMLVAFACCWLGDLLLIPRPRRYFWLGVGVFLLGHVAFAVSFVDRGIDTRWLLASLLVLIPALNGAVVWLNPHLAGRTRAATLAYLVAISAMAAMAIGATGASGRWQLGAGALLFAASDVLVARQRFVEPSFGNRLIGLPLYYAGQLLLALASG